MDTAVEKKATEKAERVEDRKPKAFEGLTRQPVCEMCVAEAEEQEEEVEREPPPRIERVQGRPPEVDTSDHFCPQEGCRYYGWLDRGNIIANGASEWRPMATTEVRGVRQVLPGDDWDGILRKQ